LTLVLRDAALDYAARGWRVLPLIPRDKRPVLSEWQKCATSDATTIDSHWDRMPTANVGVLMGPGSGLVDFETDDDDAARTLTELFDGDFPACPTFKSSRGVHRIFRYSSRLPSKATHKIGKLDIKIGANGRGSQCVFPPSIHPSGARYEWLPRLSPDDVDPPEIPETVLRKLEAAIQPNGKPQENGASQPNREKTESALAALNRSRADDYGTWLSVGMALHAEDTGLLDLWDRWSQRSPKYKLGECAAKWDGFSATGNGARPVTIATVFKWATDDGWKPTRANDHATPAQARQRERLKVISSAELANTEAKIPYLIDGILVAGQPCILAGGKKTLKTNVSVDLVLSLAQAGLFLGKFKVQNAVRVALLSGESGRATIAETARRIAAAKKCALENFEHVLWGFNLPRLGEPGCHEALDEFIRNNELAAVVIDPTYLALPLGDSASNLFHVGEKLADVNEVFQQNGCTAILSHHTRKNSVNPFDPPELEDIAWAGFPEWARQWLLIGRRKKYNPEQGGHHELWVNVGGSVGHSSLWAVNIDEGTRDDPGGRRWAVNVLKAAEARAHAAGDQRQRREAVSTERLKSQSAEDREKVLRVAERFPAGQTKSGLRDASGVRSGRFDRVLADLITARELEPCSMVKGNGRSYEGYRRSRTQPDAIGQVARPDASSTHTDTPLL
jgi:hypothetical protein